MSRERNQNCTRDLHTSDLSETFRFLNCVNQTQRAEVSGIQSLVWAASGQATMSGVLRSGVRGLQQLRAQAAPLGRRYMAGAGARQACALPELDTARLC